MTDLLSLPPYRGPSHGLEALERLAMRETLRRGHAWADLPFSHRNNWLASAACVLNAAIALVQDDPAVRRSPVIQRGVQTIDDLCIVEAWVRYQHIAGQERVRGLGWVRDAFEGRAF